jgi:hypothetical protein
MPQQQKQGTSFYKLKTECINIKPNTTKTKTINLLILMKSNN